MRAVEGAGAYRIRHPLGLHNAPFRQLFLATENFLGARREATSHLQNPTGSDGSWRARGTALRAGRQGSLTWTWSGRSRSLSRHRMEEECLAHGGLHGLGQERLGNQVGRLGPFAGQKPLGIRRHEDYWNV